MTPDELRVLADNWANNAEGRIAVTAALREAADAIVYRDRIIEGLRAECGRWGERVEAATALLTLIAGDCPPADLLGWGFGWRQEAARAFLARVEGSGT